MRTTLTRAVRIGFATWLVLYTFLAIWFPRWGTIIPHDHIARGEITAADWRAHDLAHQRAGEDAQSVPVAARDTLDSSQAAALMRIIAVYHSDAVISIGSARVALLDNALPFIAARERIEKIIAYVLPVPRDFLALLDPPPKSIL